MKDTINFLGGLTSMVIFLAAAMMVVTACSSQTEQREALTRHQRIWSQQGIKNYQYRLQVNCFCPQEITEPVTVKVSNGITTSVSYVATGMPAQSEYFVKYDTVDKLFLIIDNALKQGADEITVTYDETFGFPTHINIDFVKQAIDDEIAYNVTEFRKY